MRNAVSAAMVAAIVLSLGVQAANVTENFESAEVGVTPENWSGSCSVAAQSGTYARAEMPGYPIDGAHTKMLAVEGTAVRAYNTAQESGNRVVDLMVMAEELPTADFPEVTGDEQIKFAFDNNGCANIYHRPTAGGSAQWSKISETVYPAGTWVRVTFTFDYTAVPPMCQVKLDGSPCTSAYGFRSPTDVSKTGSWYYTAKTSTALSQIDFLGCGGVDDVVNAATSAETPYEPAYVGPTATNGVDVAWLNKQGIAWADTDVQAPGSSGYTVKEAFQTGVDPYGDYKLYMAASSATEAQLSLTFNGCGREYRVEMRTTPFTDGESLGETAEGTFTPKEAANTTTWTGALPTRALTYYRVRVAEALETINQFAVLKVDSNAKNTLVALPWKTLTPSATNPDNITAAKVVLPETLTPGDYLLYYDGGFKGWVLNNGAWEAIPSATQIGTITADAPEATALARGQAIWVVRSNTSKPIYLCGQYLATKGNVSVAEGGSLLASPDMMAAFTVSGEKIANATAGDRIVVPPTAADALPKVFEFKDGAWGTDVVTSVPGPNGANMSKHTWTTSGEVMNIPAGKGFMYQPKAAGATVTW